MKDIKIVIKCDGLTVRTKDLSLGQSIINHISTHGIMNHALVSFGWLEKINSVLSTSIGIMEKLMGIKQYEEPVSDEKAVFDNAARNITNAVKRGFDPKDLKLVPTGIKMKAWTIEEDKYLCDHITDKPDTLAKDSFLGERHTKWAIKTRLSVLKNRKFERMNSDRANVLNAYLSGNEVSTPVANINRRGNTPIVDAIERKVMKSSYNKKTKTVQPLVLWTADEKQLLVDNIKLKDSELAELFPNRTKAAVIYQKYAYLKRGNKVHAKGGPKKTWTTDQENAIKLNLKMSPSELKKLPWLKGKTLSQISNKKFILSHSKTK